MSCILQTKRILSEDVNRCLTLQASTHNGIRQQPNQQPNKSKPPIHNQVKTPFCFSVRVTICCLQLGQTHWLGNSVGIKVGAAAYIVC